MKSLKISEVHNYPNELLKRLRGVKSPGKRKLVQDVKDSNWEAVYEELLYRIELYTRNKVVNYTRKALAELVFNIANHTPAVLASALYEKNFGTQVLEPEEGIEFPEFVDIIVSNCVPKIIANIEKAVDDGEFELSELFDINDESGFTNYKHLMPGDIIIDEIKSYGVDLNIMHNENETVFDFVYNTVEDRVRETLIGYDYYDDEDYGDNADDDDF